MGNDALVDISGTAAFEWSQWKYIFTIFRAEISTKKTAHLGLVSGPKEMWDRNVKKMRQNGELSLDNLIRSLPD